MSKPKMPEQPDPAKIGEEQFNWFTKAAEFSKDLNQTDQIAPWGSTTFQEGPVLPDNWANWTQEQRQTYKANHPDWRDYGAPGSEPVDQQVIKLSPEQQAAYDSMSAARTTATSGLPTSPFTFSSGINTMMPTNFYGYQSGAPTGSFSADRSYMPTGMWDAPNTMPGGTFTADKSFMPGNMYTADRSYLPTDSFSVDKSFMPAGMYGGLDAMPAGMFDAPDASRADAVERALYDRRLGLISPELERADEMKRLELAERGIPIGSEIYNDEMDRLSRQRNEALAGIAGDATLAGGAESSRILGDALRTRQQQFGEAGQRYAQDIGTRQQQIDEMMKRFGIDVGARQQQFSELMSRYGIDLGERQQQFAEEAQRWSEQLGERQQQAAEAGQTFDQASAERQQQFAELMQRYGIDLGERQQQFAEDAQLYSQDLGTRQQQFQEAAARAAEEDRLLAQALTLRNQPYNEWASIVSGAPIQTPQFVSQPGYNVQAPDVTAGQYANYNNALNQYNTQMNSFWSGLMGLGSAAMPFLMSDERTKEDIEEVGETHEGLPIYTFKYRHDPDGPTHMGVMAREAEEVHPEAVWSGPMGIKFVDYSRIAA